MIPFIILTMTIYEQIQNAVDFIELNLFTDLSLDMVSKNVYMSSRSFYNYFWSVTGFNFKEYLVKRRLTEAQKLLLSTHNKIIDIAYQVGYKSPEAFSRAFKNEFKITAKDLRKSKTPKNKIDRINLYKEKYMGVIIKELRLMRTMSFSGFKPDPEDKAIGKMKKWLSDNKAENEPYRIFGHNIDDSGQISHDPYNLGYKIYLNLDNEKYYETFKDKIEYIQAGKFFVTGIEGNFTSDPTGHWIKRGWEQLHKMIAQKGFKKKYPARYYEESLDPEIPGNLRLDLYLEVE